MIQKKATLAGLLSLLVATVVSGCGGPPPVETVDWDADELTAKALELYDSNGDGAFDDAELAEAPGLLRAKSYLDTDKDGKLSEAELHKRLTVYAQLGTGMRSAKLVIKVKGRPVRNAEVKLVPEKFIEGVIPGAKGTTDEIGVVAPADLKDGIRAIRYGFYRLEVQSPDVENPKVAEAAKKQLGFEYSPEGEESYGDIVINVQP